MFGPLSLHIEGGKAIQFYYDNPPLKAMLWFAISDLYEVHYRPLWNWLAKQQRAEKSLLQNSYEELRTKGDPRIISQEGKASAVQRKHLSYRFILNAKDNSWAKKTRIPEFFKRHRKFTTELLQIVEADEKSQSDVLGSLIS